MAHRRYIHIFPRPGFIFDEIIACYKAAASRLEWMSVSSWPAEWSANRPEWQDPNNTIILWWVPFPTLLDVVPPQRKAAFAIRYMESIGPFEKLCSLQKSAFTRSLRAFEVPDVLFVESPSAAEFIRPYCQKAAAYPVGYDPEVMGTPDWSTPKEYDFGFCGIMTGRRDWIIPALKRRFGSKFIQIWGPYGLERKRIYDRCRVALYVPHSEEICLPGMRIWQFISSSAALVMEKRDGWPAIAGRHYIELPEAKESELDKFIDQVEQVLKQPLEEIARRAHTELSGYTVEKAMEYITSVL